MPRSPKPQPLPCENDNNGEAHQILAYNQQLVEFADSKAGNFILINSLFIAATQAMPQSPVLKWISAGFIFCSAISVLLCLSVIMSRPAVAKDPRVAPSKPLAPDFVFFGDILRRPDGQVFADEFDRTDEHSRRRGVLTRSYIVAEIAARKFRTLAPAQALTAVSAALWVIANLVAVFVS